MFPVTCAYGLGLTIARMMPYSSDALAGWAILFAVTGLLSIALSVFKCNRSSMLFVCVAAMAFGGIRMTPFNHEFTQAQKILKEEKNANLIRTIIAEIKVAHPNSDGTSGRLILQNVVLLDDSKNRLTFPGYIRLSWGKHNFPFGSTFLPGDWITFRGNIYPFRGYYRSLEDIADINSYQQQYAIARTKGEIELTVFGNSISGRLEKFRRSMVASICKHVPGNEGKLAASMLFNDRALLDRESHSAFASSGLFHLFAASGLHVALLAAVFMLVLSPFTFLRRFNYLLVIVLMFLYCWMLNFNTPVVRASVMIGMLYLGNLFKQPTDTFNRLVIAVFIICLFFPMSIFQTGFHLSVLCVVSILLLAPTIRLWLTPQDSDDDPFDGEMMMYLPDSFRKWLRYGLPADIGLVVAVFSLMLPAQVYYFGQCNLLSPLANLIGVPLTQIAMPSTILTMILSPISETAANYAGATTALLYSMLDYWANLFGNANMFIIRSSAIPVYVIFILYAILFSGSYVSYRHSPEYRSKSLAQFFINFGIVLCILLFVPMIGQINRMSNLHMWFLDVGQGDATLIVTPSGQTILVDCGPGRPNAAELSVLPKLRELGINRIDVFVVSHTDKDHIGSLETLTKQMPITSILCQDSDKESIEKLVVDKSFDWIAGDSLDLGKDVYIDIMNIEAPGHSVSDKNANSLVLQLRWHNFAALLMGDATIATELKLMMEDQRLLRNISVLKAGHHGANSSTGQTFVRKVAPTVAIISCGVENSYGHPHDSVLERLNEHGIKVCRTDKMGTIELSTDGTKYELSIPAEDAP